MSDLDRQCTALELAVMGRRAQLERQALYPNRYPVEMVKGGRRDLQDLEAALETFRLLLANQASAEAMLRRWRT